MSTSVDHVKVFYDHYEQRRAEKVKIVLSEREQILDEEAHGTFVPVEQSTRKAQLTLQPVTDSSMLEREKRTLAKIKKKQEDEIMKLIEQEMLKQDRNRKNSEKTRLQQEKELRRKMEVEERRQQQEEER